MADSGAVGQEPLSGVGGFVSKAKSWAEAGRKEVIRMEKEQEAQVLEVLFEIDKKLDTIVELLDILVTVAKKAASLQNI